MRTLTIRRHLRCLLAVSAWALATAAIAQVSVTAPAPLDAFIRRHLQPPSPAAAGAALDAFARATQRSVAELLATEGYFSADISVRAEPGRVSVAVSPGARALVSEVRIEIQGDIPAERRQALIEAWALGRGQAFRDEDWNNAKQLLLGRLLEVDYPAAHIVDSRAEVDPETAQARLHVTYRSGPRHVFGELEISGLSRQSRQLIDRYSNIEPGGRYDASQLLALQSALQRTPYFSSVAVEIVQTETEPGAGPVRAPVRIHVRERAAHRLSFGVGYSSNTGARTEANYQGVDFLRRAWQLDTGVRLEQLRQGIHADIHLPMNNGRRDSFGTLAEWEDIEGLRRRRLAVGAVRTQTHGSVETRYALNWQTEHKAPQDGPASTQKALTLDGSWMRRRIHDMLDPRAGYVIQLQAGGGTKVLLSDQNFLRLHARYQHFLPVARRDVLTLRGELGATLAPGREGIPQDFLFRTGGAQTVRGYDYQSLGVPEGNAVVGGRYLAVASAEYTHWFDAKWGAAAFVDAGNAGDDRKTLAPLAVGYGAGARWKSPVGPLAVDLAYGEKTGKVRIHFSLAVAF